MATNPEWIPGSPSSSLPSGTSGALFSVVLQLGDNNGGGSAVELNLNTNSATGGYTWGTNGSGYVDTNVNYPSNHGVPITLDITDITQANCTATLTVGSPDDPNQATVEWALSNDAGEYTQLDDIAFGVVINIPHTPAVTGSLTVQWVDLTITTYDSNDNASNYPLNGTLATADCPVAVAGGYLVQRYVTITQDTTNGTIPVRVSIQGDLLMQSTDPHWNNSTAYSTPGNIPTTGMKAFIWAWGY